MFDRSARALARGVPIRKTAAGIWVPATIPQLVEVVTLLHEMGVLGAAAPPAPVVEAGMGDGRAAAVLAHFDPARPVYGIERDPVLHARAVDNLAALRRWRRGYGALRLVEGDYCEPATYASCGLDLRDPLVIVNYPDGNQRRLARFVARHAGPSATLCLFTHDRSLDIDELPLHARRDVPADGSLPWRLSVYRQPAPAARGEIPRRTESGQAPG